MRGITILTILLIVAGAAMIAMGISGRSKQIMDVLK